MGASSHILAILYAIVKLWGDVYGAIQRQKTEDIGAIKERGIASARAYENIAKAIATRRDIERQLSDPQQLRSSDRQQRSE